MKNFLVKTEIILERLFFKQEVKISLAPIQKVNFTVDEPNNN
jgi:hypothetical protein